VEPALVDECSMNKASGAVKAEKNLTYKAIVCEDLRDGGFIILETYLWDCWLLGGSLLICLEDAKLIVPTLTIEWELSPHTIYVY
jgi:hypothetical protein